MGRSTHWDQPRWGKCLARSTIRAAIRKKIEPWLMEQGFKGDYPEFHRLTGKQYQGLAIRKNKYGGSFWFEVGAKPFSAARYKRLKLTEPEKAILPRLHEIDPREREVIHPRMSPEELLREKPKDLQLDGKSKTPERGKDYSRERLEEAASECLPAIQRWFAARMDD